MKHARLSIRVPSTGEVCLGGGGQVGALVACVVRGGGDWGQVDLVCAFGVHMAHNTGT